MVEFDYILIVFGVKEPTKFNLSRIKIETHLSTENNLTYCNKRIDKFFRKEKLYTEECNNVIKILLDERDFCPVCFEKFRLEFISIKI